MTIVTVSPKFQVVIPLSIRKTFNVDPGEQMQIISYNGRIELIPLRSMRSMRGFLKGMNSTIEREPDRI